MKNQLYYEDVSVGQEVPALKKSVNTVNITMYLATVWLMDRIHFDRSLRLLRGENARNISTTVSWL